MLLAFPVAVVSLSVALVRLGRSDHRCVETTCTCDPLAGLLKQACLKQRVGFEVSLTPASVFLTVEACLSVIHSLDGRRTVLRHNTAGIAAEALANTEA